MLGSDYSRGGQRKADRTRILLCVLFSVASAPAAADTHTWTDAAAANSNWSEAGNWSPSGQPSTGDVAIVLTPGVGVGPVVVNAQTLSLAQLQVADNAGNPQVQILAGQSLVFGGGDLLNDGLVVVNSDGLNQIAKIRFAASGLDSLHTLSGDGTILLQAGPGLISPMPAIIETASSVLTQEAGHTIRGVGRITASMVNNGSIIADNLPAPPGDNRLELITGGITNNGLLSAGAGATLDIVGTYSVSQGANGVIRADGGTVLLRNFVVVNGGTLESTGSGVIRNSVGAPQLFDVVNEADYEISNSAVTRVNGSGLTNNGQVKVFGTLDYLLSGALGGSGEVVMSSSGAMLSSQTGVVVTHGPSHSIRGVGQVNAALINNGTLRAESGTLRITFWQKTNNHEMRAASGGTLQIETEVAQDPNTGLIIAENGGIVRLNSPSSRVTAGRLQSTGTGVFHAGDNAQLWDVVNEATIEARPMSVSGNMFIGGSGLTNDGTIIVNPALQGGSFQMSFCCDPQMTLDGAGVIDLNHTNATMLVGALTHEASHTIQGRGQISGDIINEGTIAGDSSAFPIRFNDDLTGTGALQNVRIAGTHAPGNNGPHHQTVTGLYEVVTGGKVNLEIGGPTYATDIDWVDVLGNITLAGTIEVELTGGYFPGSPAGFPLVTSTGGRTGTFTNAILPDLPGGLYTELEYDSFSVNLAVKGIAGDYNYDGLVDAADYIVWRKTLGQVGTGLAADGNNSGEVDQRDLNVWRTNFGQAAPGAGAGAGTTASDDRSALVPEPAGMSTMLAGVVAFVLYWPHVRSLSTADDRRAG